MTDYPKPSRNQADEGSLAGVLNVVLRKHLQGVDDMLPARVLAYDRATNRVQVQPLIKMVLTNETLVERGQIASLPVLQLGGGGFIMSFPIAAGNLGWIKANDRDISLFKKTYSDAPPNTNRFHSFSDALFIPDVMTGYTIASEDQGNAVLQNLAGTVKIALFPNKVKITSPNIEIVGDVSITGAITNNGKNIGSTHVHSGVQTGISNTGQPT